MKGSNEEFRNFKGLYNDKFCHVHTHSQGSLLDGAINENDLASMCIKRKMPMVITDHGNVMITLRALNACKDAVDEEKKRLKNEGKDDTNVGLDLIRGCEIYLEKGKGAVDEDYEGSYYHLVLLPYSKEGFENINTISSLGFIEGAHSLFSRIIPVVKRETLKKYSAGIIALSACMFGECSSIIWNSYPYMNLYKEIIGESSKLIDRWAKEIINFSSKNSEPKSSESKSEKKRTMKRKPLIEEGNYSEEQVFGIVFKNKHFVKLKEEFLDALFKATDEQIISCVTESLMAETIESIRYYQSIFKDNFYLEIQDHGFFEQKVTAIIYKHLIKTGKVNAKIVITNDCHYLNKEDWMVQDMLLCINQKAEISDENRFKFTKHELYFKTYDEMKQCFNYLDEEEKCRYLKETCYIADKCLEYKPSFKEMYYPTYDVSEDIDGVKDINDYLWYKIVMGARNLSSKKSKDFRYRIFNLVDFKESYAKIKSLIDFKTANEYVLIPEKQSQIISIVDPGIDKATEEILGMSFKNHKLQPSKSLHNKYYEALRRLIYEYAIVVIKKIPDYYFIVKKMLDMARENDIPIGPGRGSAAGSAIAYMLGITKIDPITYNLKFERFINPERNSYPDIDSDISQRRRQEAKQNAIDFFGIEYTCGINAYGNFRDRNSVQRCLKAYGFSPAECLRVSKLIRSSIDDIFNDKKTKEMYDTNENFKNAIIMAKKITGRIKNAGTHAAGLLIVAKNINLIAKMPVMAVGKERLINTQYDKNDVEHSGFLKLDLLGLRTLDIIDDARKLIKQYEGIDLDLDNIPLDDEKVFELYRRGDTDFVFQFASEGMKTFLRELAPRNIEDLILAVSGYRPGPMEKLPEFIKIRNGEQAPHYEHECLRPILESTGGIPFYQEQVMDIFRAIGGYSLGRADLVRRAMSKKKEKELKKEKAVLVHGEVNEDGTVVIPGCLRLGISEEIANKVFDDVEDFASYGFNKSHAAAYVRVGYQTAYECVYYYFEFVVAVLCSVETNKEKMAKYVEIVRKNGIKISRPDINKSKTHVSIWNFEGKEAYIGLLSIKDVGEKISDAIVEERDANGDFKDFDDFVRRTLKYRIDKGTIAALINSGVFDCFDENYIMLFKRYEKMSAYYESISDIPEGQLNMFSFPEVRRYAEYMMDEDEYIDYDVNGKIKLLNEYNYMLLTDEINKYYKNIEYGLKEWKKSENLTQLYGSATGIIMEDFELSKKGKAYLSKIILLSTGDIYKIVVTSKNVDELLKKSSLDDISDVTKGTVVDLNGSYKVEKYIADSSDEEDEEDVDSSDVEEESKVVVDRTVFPRAIIIRKLNGIKHAKGIYIDMDFSRYPREYEESYFGMDSKEAVKNILKSKRFSREISIKYNNNLYKSKTASIDINKAKKIGFEFKEYDVSENEKR